MFTLCLRTVYLGLSKRTSDVPTVRHRVSVLRPIPTPGGPGLTVTSPRRPVRLLATAGIAVLGLLVAACGSSSKKSSTSSTTVSPGATTTVKLSPATLNGSGSTFQLAFNQEAIQEFVQKNPGITINYAGGGSSKGLTDLASKLTDFAGTDTPITDYTKYGGESAVLYFPTVVAPITVAYNLSGVSKLTLSAPTIAKIFSGKITTWNDPAITADNPGTNLPSTKITPVHRSDGSGTTKNFTQYLSKAAASDWTNPSSTTWPAGFPGGTGSGNPGVAQTIKSTPGAIGYVDYSTATSSNLSLASIKNSSGKPIEPTLQGASAAVANIIANPNLTYDPTNAQGTDAYPITSPTWIVIYKNQTDKAKGEALKAWLNFILTTGQTQTAQTAGYAPLQGALLQKAQAQLDQIVIPAS
jgi:phosphate transport system substrate-binding protein